MGSHVTASTPRGSRWPRIQIFRKDAGGLAQLADDLTKHGLQVTVVESDVGGTLQHGRELALMTISDLSDWQALHRLVGNAAVVLVVMEQGRPELCRRALAAGAVGVVSPEARAAEVLAAVHAAWRGQILLPAPLLRRVLAPTWDALPPGDRQLLEQLATARTFAQIASDHGCSERTLYRRAQRLYARLQVAGRREAVAVWHESVAPPEPSFAMASA